MQEQNQDELRKLSQQITEICCDMMQVESSLLKRTDGIRETHLRSARNLAHYLALRRHDIRTMQAQLARLGLSSLGRSESHVLDTLQSVQHVLSKLLGDDPPALCDGEAGVLMGEGAGLIEKNTEALFGPAPPGRKVRIMVTMATDAASDYELVRGLMASGMDCMRINCAHDGPDVWLGMIQNLQRARQETGRSCRLLMDIAGPKLRTGAIEPGPAVVKCRPQRDVYGRVTAAARIWITSEGRPESAPAKAAATLQFPVSFLGKMRAGDALRFRDARKAGRSLRITHANDHGFWAEARQTIYFVPGIEVELTRNARAASNARRTRIVAKARTGKLPAIAQTLLLRQGETLLLTRANEPGKPAAYSKLGLLLSPAQISVTLPQMLDHAKPGEPIWFDDGKIGGVIRAVDPECVSVEITQAREKGEKLGAEKGINLPETQIDIPALTDEDIAALPFIVEHADLIGYSFVRTEADVCQLREHLEQLKGQHLGLILKIETRKGFDNLPKLILAAMHARSVGVMIARGDLAVECGYERLAEVQEEMLWICEAAHVPVIWATQVLENLAKKGIPSRSEVTDAAMGERAECVMLNKGPYAVIAVRVLADILKRMQAHQEKKRSMLRPLRLAASFGPAN
ncbi:MAG TPA: pyruvate kinase [Candidatus Acidoferrales bacterium]|nr:pyruvate kinase [Candidatus Acidoferrales bacterium]